MFFLYNQISFDFKTKNKNKNKNLFSFFLGTINDYENYLVKCVCTQNGRPWFTRKKETILCIYSNYKNIIDFILQIMTVRARLLASGLLVFRVHGTFTHKPNTKPNATRTPAAPWSMACTKRQGSFQEHFLAVNLASSQYHQFNDVMISKNISTNESQMNITYN